MTIRLSTGLRNAIAGGPGFGPALADGVIYVYSGPQPLNADSAATGTLLGIVTKGGGAFAHGTATNGLTFAAAANGAVTKSTDRWEMTGLAEGTAGWFRFCGNPADNGASSSTLARMDGTVGTPGAGDMSLSSIAIVSGMPSSVNVFQFTVPAQ